jgi:hypothetical protein
MADFSENMKAFTDRLKTSIDDRAESLANTHQATTDLLDAARMFMNNVAVEHEARAESVNDFMARSHADRAESVKAMRDMHCEELAATSDEMRRMLDENMTTRAKYVAEFMTTSHANRCETAQAMRDNHREELAAMSDELHHTLDEANKMRLETVGAMRKTFQEARQTLATDLQDAANTWRQFAARSPGPSLAETSSPPAKPTVAKRHRRSEKTTAKHSSH